MVTLMTFTLWEKEGSVGVVGLEDTDAFMNGITGLDSGGEVSSKSTISNVLVFDEQDDELTLLDPLMLPLHACPNCGSNK